MARILKEFEFKASVRGSVHPWSEWTDGKIRELVRGTDFQGRADMLGCAMRNKAKKLGMTVRLAGNSKTSEKLIVQFVRLNGEEAQQTEQSATKKK